MNQRIYKFRAWDGEWRYFTLFQLAHGEADLLELENWCEFTGLHDKDWTEIYEGDIVEDDEGNRKEITWMTVDGIPSYCLQYVSGNPVPWGCLISGIRKWRHMWSLEPYLSEDRTKDYKIIGNVFEK